MIFFWQYISTVLAFTALVGCGSGEDIPDVGPQVTIEPADQLLVEEKGFAITRIEVASLQSAVVVAEIDQNVYVAEVVGVDNNYPSGLSAGAAIEQKNAAFVIGSGFVDSFVPLVPVGYLIIDGATVSKPSLEGFETLLAVVNRKVSLVPTENWQEESISGAFQTGPRLVEGGQLSELNSKRPPATRAFVGTRGGIVVAGVTLGRVHLRPLAEFLIASSEEGGLALDEAVNLSGGGAEVFLYHEGDRDIGFGDIKSRQAALLTFRLKSNLVRELAMRMNVSAETSAECIRAVVESITNRLAAGQVVNIFGFGTFAVTVRANRTGRNPRTGELIQIASARVPTFKSGRLLKDRVRIQNTVGSTAIEPDVISPHVEFMLLIGAENAAACATALFEEIATELARGDAVPLKELGTFSIRRRAARTGRNPRTGESITIRAENVVSFKPGKALKDALN